MKSEIVNDVVGYLESQNIEVNDVYFENICRDVNVHFNMSYLPDIAYIKYIDDTTGETLRQDDLHGYTDETIFNHDRKI